jgi:hypothetical protein
MDTVNQVRAIPIRNVAIELDVTLRAWIGNRREGQIAGLARRE